MKCVQWFFQISKGVGKPLFNLIDKSAKVHVFSFVRHTTQSRIILLFLKLLQL